MKTILIIEDDKRILEISKIAIEMMSNWVVLTANSGFEGIEIAAEKQPDLILLDVMMPMLDGKETLLKLRANKNTAKINVLLLTAQSDISSVVKGLDVDGILKKPFDAITLVDTIKEKLGWEDEL